MKFKFRLQPFLKIAERELCLVTAELEEVRDGIRQIDQLMVELEETKVQEDQELEVACRGYDVGLFYQRRQARERDKIALVNRRFEFVEAEKKVEERLTDIKREIYRLESVREKHLLEFQAEVRSAEDKELDEIGTLRYSAGG